MLNNLKKQNLIVESLNNQIDNLINEKAQINEIFGIIKIGVDLFGAKIVNTLLRNGGEEYLRNTINKTISGAGERVEDFMENPKITSNTKNKIDLNKITSDFEEIKTRIDKKLSQRQSYDNAVVADRDESFSAISLKFEDNFKLSVKADTAKEYETSFSGRHLFDILTTKKTNQGYILNVSNDNLPNNVSLLIYLKGYRRDRSQSVYLQLTYKNGRYNGNKKSGDIRIIKLT